VTWYRTIKADLFTNPEYRKKLGSAIWLYGYLIMNADRLTGKKNHRVKDMVANLRSNGKQVQRWLRKLENKGKIKTRRLSSGYHIAIENWSDVIHLTGQKCPVTSDEQSDISIPVIGQKVDGDRTIESDYSKNIQLQNGEKEKGNPELSDNDVRSDISLLHQSNKTINDPDSFFDPESKKTWESVKGELERRMLPDNYRVWFAPTIGLVMRPDKVLIGVPNRFYEKCLQENYKPQIREALREVAGFEQPPAPEFQIMSG